MPYKNREDRNKYKREWTARRRAEWFSGKTCVDCGSRSELEIDHIDPTLKVSHRVFSWSAERRDAELAKCQVLCRSCHDMNSIGDMEATRGFSPATHGSRAMYTHHGCRCRPCADANAARMRDYRAGRKTRLATV